MIPVAHDYSPRRFATSLLQPRERLPFWREVFCRQAVRIDVAPQADGFRAEAVVRSIDGLRRVTIASTPGRAMRQGALLEDGDASVTLMIARQGGVRCRHAERESELHGGMATLLVHDRPCTILHGLVRYDGVVIDRARFDELVTDVASVTNRPVPRDLPALTLLRRYLETLHPCTDAKVNAAVARHVTDLAALVAGAGRDAADLISGRGVAAAALAVFKAEVVREIGRPDLSVTMLATRHGVSPRYIQKLFEADGTTFSAFRLEQQLARAHTLLSAKSARAMSIAAIALAAGFSDISYFNRTFRRRYGATPSDIRVAAIAAERANKGRDGTD